MEKNIVLPGYKSIVKNTIFYKEDTSEVIGKGVVHSQHTFLLRRYIEPSEKELAGYLRKKAEEILLIYPCSEYDFKEMSDLEIKIAMLKRKDIESIAKGRDETIKPFMEMSFAGKEPKKYFEAMYGLLLVDDIIKKQRESVSGNLGLKEYLELLNFDYLKAWELKIKADNWKLPKKRDVIRQLELKVERSNIIELRDCRKDYYPLEETRNFVCGFYNALGNKDVSIFTDCSAEILEDFALSLIDDFANEHGIEGDEWEDNNEEDEPEEKNDEIPKVINERRNLIKRRNPPKDDLHKGDELRN